MDKRITSCWVCGRRVREGVIGMVGTMVTEEGRVTEMEWVVCEECRPRAATVSGEARVLPEERGVKMEMVYVCAPFKGATEEEMERNRARAKAAAVTIGREHEEGGRQMPLIFVPHLAFEYVEEGRQRGWAMDMCVEMVRRSRRMVVCGGEVTEGMEEEMKEARLWGVGIKIREDL